MGERSDPRPRRRDRRGPHRQRPHARRRRRGHRRRPHPRNGRTRPIVVPLLRGVVGDAEGLPFPDDTFDAVSCRIAAHHFPDPATFVAEVARVLAPGGVFVLEDNVAPDDEVLAEFLNRVERLRDPTHVESYSEQRWRDWLDDAGFVVEETAWVRRTLEFDSWVERIGVPQARLDELQAAFDKAPNAARRYFDIWYAEDGVASFTTPKLLVRARA
ncbi:class I SAM-dependent methyltransferase [Haladaptatus sp. GCM10025707]|uniref:class I SAM-dependent methyltransferase n=1 Tax=Haladaptatus sp. GCM10025707 TaxID=3252658 RepID=UPI0036229A71